jgi:hypothetical protein
VKAPGWLTTGRVRVEAGNLITRWMIWLSSGEICGSEPETDSLGFASFGVGDGGSGVW